MIQLQKSIFYFFVIYLISACEHISPESRNINANNLAVSQGWQKLRLATNNFLMVAYVPSETTPSNTLSIYIEGDGLAWLTSTIASDNPTPRQPIGLQLALKHPNNSVAYLARPCQYVEAKDWGMCQQSIWTNRRFSPEVISASSQAIDTLKQRFNAQKIVLIGYSGGGAVAALVAARRQDVVQLITVAGNLDHVTWTNKHRITPLSGSLNPADEWKNLQWIPQLHLVGAQDENIDLAIAESYAARFPPAHRPVIKVIPNMNHVCCWVAQWPALLDLLPVQ